MTRERIEDMREVVLPFVKKRLLETNYENLGESDAEEFAMEFNEILDLAIKALEQEPTDKYFTKADIDSIVTAINAHWELIIDEIRAEIKKSSHGKWYVGRLDGKTEEVLLLDEVLQIIDKYKAETEANDGSEEQTGENT